MLLRDLLIKGIRYGTKNSRPYIMKADNSVNIDTKNDLVLAEILLRKENND